jgi:DNA-binding MarR family transcriptional regulator
VLALYAPSWKGWWTQQRTGRKLGTEATMEDRVTNLPDRHGTGVAEVPVLPCFCANLRRAARLCSKLYEREAGWPNLSVAQFDLLRAIARTGTITHGDLGSLLGLDQTTVSRSLATLRRRDWIRVAPGDDRRERRVALTGAGKLQLRRGDRAWRRAQARLRRWYGPDKWEAMQRELTAVAATIPMMPKNWPRGSRA